METMVPRLSAALLLSSRANRNFGVESNSSFLVREDDTGERIRQRLMNLEMPSQRMKDRKEERRNSETCKVEGARMRQMSEVVDEIKDIRRRREVTKSSTTV